MFVIELFIFEFYKKELLAPVSEPAPARWLVKGIGEASRWFASVVDALLYGESDKCWDYSFEEMFVLLKYFLWLSCEETKFPGYCKEYILEGCYYAVM